MMERVAVNAERGTLNAERRVGGSAVPPPIEERALDYSVRVVKLFRHLKRLRDEAATIFGRQLLRAASSVGANLVEARGGESRADFVHKCAIAQKEAREALYWLKLIARAGLVSEAKLSPLVGETNEILSIVTSIIRKTKANSQSSKRRPSS